MQPLKIPLSRTPRDRTDPIGRCIYCGTAGGDVELTDEHIVPDGLGGDLVIPDASCKRCASLTSRAELHLLREVMHYTRAVVGVSSRKRKPSPQTVEVKFDGSTEDATQLVLNGKAPFLFLFPTTDELPEMLGGTQSGQNLRLSLFGPRDWNEKGKEWLGGTGSIKWKNRMHPGIIGQALAKIAHAYACAAIGVDAFEPLVVEYILSQNPSFDGRHIGIYSSEGAMDCLHFLDLQTAKAPIDTVLGKAYQTVYVVAIRLFAHQPSPCILVVVGKPNGSQIASLKEMKLGAAC